LSGLYEEHIQSFNASCAFAPVVLVRTPEFLVWVGYILDYSVKRVGIYRLEVFQCRTRTSESMNDSRIIAFL
jgi:hypothetical protein